MKLNTLTYLRILIILIIPPRPARAPQAPPMPADPYRWAQGPTRTAQQAFGTMWGLEISRKLLEMSWNGPVLKILKILEIPDYTS
jgi:hypothetical protein